MIPPIKANEKTDEQKYRKLLKKKGFAEFLIEVLNRVAVLASLDEQLEVLVKLTAEVLDGERASLFINDPDTNELYSRIALGTGHREIRILNNRGIAGQVFQTKMSLIINNAREDKRFDTRIDELTQYQTLSILCCPIRTLKGEVIGVAQVLNKKKGYFTQNNLRMLEAIMSQVSIFLQSAILMEKIQKARQQELEFLTIVSDVSSEIQLGPLLKKIMNTITNMLNVERSTLFLNDDKTNELFTEIGQGLGASKIKFPNHLGIAGTVFHTGTSVNIPYAYADLRFNPSFDKQTGFFTRSILCVPIVNKDGKRIGVTQVLNRKGGPFSDDDEARLRAFSAQISIALESAKLFDDMQNTKNYLESILESMTNGVLTLNEEGSIATCNLAASQILQSSSAELISKPADSFFTGLNAWVMERIQLVQKKQEINVTVDAELTFGENKVSVNLTVMPLIGNRKNRLGTLLLLEDISNEKRVKSTMARYMDTSLADKLLQAGEDILGGQSKEATILFSDIREFTTISEQLGAHATVAMLNEYFTLMVDCIQQEGGVLDKFIGDAMMAVFGIPIAREDDQDRSVRAAISMMKELKNLNHQLLNRGLKQINIGIGINTDTIVSGNIGSPKRMDYTVIGDGVNLASRLESASKQYGTQILIAENTFKHLRGIYRIREVDYVIVKGKTKPVAVYEVLDYHDENSFPNIVEVLNLYRDGLEKYRNQNFKKAHKAFQDALKLNPADKLSKLYLERCEAYMKTPPDSEWKGFQNLSTK